ncbi:MAG: D-glycero-beta-D-manno-heptose 1-phosphate adenylyltransferase [Saprospiraceae bacterium]|nr:D-glycero-beta-D-manno-heptose 1-phosphate adenylyltransferase [Saprospiraceae bacterium]
MEALAKITAKIMDWQQVQQQCAAWKAIGETVVFTNGCFDILHYGHLHYLAQARDLGHHLVVGMNAASSVRRLKGPNRPINDETTRTMMMASLAFVDAVVLFEEDTPLEIIQLIQPNILVKGGDWRPDQIVGSDVVLANGGQVLSLPFIDGYSTTAIETKIRSW